MSVKILFTIPTKNVATILTRLLTTGTDHEIDVDANQLADEAIEFNLDIDDESLKTYIAAIPEIMDSITRIMGDVENVGRESATARAAGAGDFDSIIQGAHQRNDARRRRDNPEFYDQRRTNNGAGDIPGSEELRRTPTTGEDNEDQDG